MKVQRVLLHYKRERIVSDATERMTTVPILLTVILAIQGKVCSAHARWHGDQFWYTLHCRCVTVYSYQSWSFNRRCSQ